MGLEQVVIGIGIFLGLFLLVRKAYSKGRDIEIISYDGREDIYDLNNELNKIRRRYLATMQKDIDSLTREISRLSKKVDSNYVNVKQMRSRVSSLEDHIN